MPLHEPEQRPPGSLDHDLVEAISRRSDEVWTTLRERRGGRFHSFVPSDLHSAHEALLEVRERGDSFLELGAGAGAVTIVADLLGFDATGVEIEPWLVESAEVLAEEFDSEARFVEGSFLPHDFDPQQFADGDFHVTYDDSSSAFDGAGFDIEDFDVVYAFPWPEEEELFDALIRGWARPDACYLAYCAGSGVSMREARPGSR
ncbi:MAG: class I SAM-dependent methyltransferase [Planctomycetota bacterium]